MGAFQAFYRRVGKERQEDEIILHEDEGFILWSVLLATENRHEGHGNFRISPNEVMVEMRGIEPLASALRTPRSPS